MQKAIFTLTAGRTGTAWIADFLGQNLEIDAVHEPLGIADFGTRMPDIRLMRSFNTYGNTPEVQRFWQGKLGALPPVYAEGNHTLGKCGLIENLAVSPLAQDAVVVVLRRGIVKQCVSYLVRGDFGNITVPWQWYLMPDYPLTLVAFAPFKGMGQLGYALWYCYEMAARQAYYQMAYGDRVSFVEAQLEEVTKPEGAARFWADLGGQGTCSLPPPKNASSTAPPAELLAQVQAITDKIAFDADAVARAAIAKGFSFESAAGGEKRSA
ncbi:hypothetical protein E4Z66_02240 [Aliishimia ponticola]|uniref:Sulfotransferase family protein n=1 Tax=Aliishimia ponticola TaxID=2499833 RepID=A0A4S4NFN7_9RHOB|nr:hypothetical protein [Aliishimia ponticola]THH38412.1 hypothetical protein E4Z66_02240 [Aliishimia ponticola]